MNTTNNIKKWDIDEDIFDSLADGVVLEQRAEEKTISNDDFITYHANEKEFRLYILRELRRIESFLSNNYEVE